MKKSTYHKPEIKIYTVEALHCILEASFPPEPPEEPEESEEQQIPDYIDGGEIIFN